MSQLEHIEAIEKRLWSAADTLCANSSYVSNEDFLPTMGSGILKTRGSSNLFVIEKSATSVIMQSIRCSLDNLFKITDPENLKIRISDHGLVH